VNPITCVGHGLCAELFPDGSELDEWGYPIIDRETIRPSCKGTRGAPRTPARRSRCCSKRE
jgi:ferredoxin